MAYINNTATAPDGTIHPVPIAGVAASSTIPLAANAKWDSGIQYYNGNEAAHFSIQADQVGSYMIEYYKAGVKINFTGQPTPYDPAIVNAFQGALSGKGDAFKLIYTNGAVAQGQFYVEIRFSDITQETLRSIGIPMSATNLGSSTHAVIEGKESGVGNYKQVSASGVDSKIGVDVFVINAPVKVSGAVTSNVATLSTSKIILPENVNRKGATITAISGTVLVNLGATTSSTAYTVRLIPNAYYEVPFGYLGVISAIGVGSVSITELI